MSTKQDLASKVGVVAVAVAAAGHADAVADRLKRAVAAMYAEGGTEIFSVHRDVKDERTFWLFELYTNRAAMVEHARGEATRGLLADLEPLLEDGAEIHVVIPQAAKGLVI